MRGFVLSALFAGALAAADANAAELTRVGPPNGRIALSVKIPPGSTLVFLAGQTGDRLNPDAPAGTPAVYGDTKTQALSAFKNMEKALAAQGMTMGDVVMMRIFIVADPANGGKPDYAGMNDAYRQFFGTPEQPNKPARMSMEISSLAGPGILIEIDVQAAKAGA